MKQTIDKHKTKPDQKGNTIETTAKIAPVTPFVVRHLLIVFNIQFS